MSNLLYRIPPKLRVALFMCFMSLSVWAQNRTITGVVNDRNGEPVPGATITYIQYGSLKGSVTSVDGTFSLDIPESVKSLTIQYLGFEEYVLSLTDATTYTVILQEDQELLDEYVVTGFQKVDRREFTGSMKKVEMSDIEQLGEQSVDKMLQGQVAGVQIENVSGTSGSRSKIRIRGNSSISGNREPLWVVDGIVIEDGVKVNPNELYSGDQSTLVGSAIAGINPNDIESITILKDASATAQYGTQAVNGVIVVTTKRGTQGKTRINYSANFMTDLKPQITNFYMMNSDERIALSEEMLDKDLLRYNHLDYYSGGFGEALKAYNDKSITEEEFQREVYRLRQENTDWMDLLFKNSFRMEHNLSISSGTDKAQYFFSVNYFKDDGNTLGQSTDRYMANARANYNLSDKLTVGFKLTANAKNQRVFNTNANPYSYALNTSRAIPQYNTDGSDYYYTYNKTPFNVFNEIDNSYSNITNMEALFQLDGEYKITDELKFNTIVSYRGTNANVERNYTEKSNVANAYRYNDDYYFRDPDLVDGPVDGQTLLPRGGIVQINNDISKFFTNRNSLSWTKIFDQHKIDLMGGEEYRSSIRDYSYMVGYGYEYFRGRTANPSYLPIKQAEIYNGSPYFGLNSSPTYQLSLFGIATYTYGGKYTINFNVRSDGSNKFGEAQRFRFLPIYSVGANWNISQEDFMQNQDFFSNLALRGSYGLRGNVDGNYSPQVMAYYHMAYALDPDDREESLWVTSPPNPDLQWEKEHIYNIALDFDIKGRVNGSLEYYNRTNFDLVGPFPVSYVSGFESVNLNWASMKNSGVEVAINTVNIAHEKFRWSTGFTFGYNKNEVLEAYYNPSILSLTNEYNISPLVGRPMSGVYAFRYAGLDAEGVATYDDGKGNIVYGVDLASTDLDALEYMGSRDPLYSGGLTNTFNYKNWNLSVLFIYSGGNKIRLNPVYSFYYNDVENVSKEMANRWQMPGDEAYTDVPGLMTIDRQNEFLQAGYDIERMYNYSNIRVVDGGYVKLRNVALGYTLSAAQHKVNGLSDVQFILQGQNLWTLASKELNGKDPEAIIQGVNTPLLSTFTLGLKASF